jgi:hypothetical protein
MSQQRLMYAAVIFVALFLLTYGLNLSTLSISLPISGNEYKAGDIISFKAELAGKVIIPATYGDCNDEIYNKPCWRFDQASFLKQDVKLAILAVDPDRVGFQMYCGDYKPWGYDSNGNKVMGIWSQAYAMPDKCTFSLRNGNLINPISCQDYEYIVSNAQDYDTMNLACTILTGTKSGLHCINWNTTTNECYRYDNYKETFKITSGDPYSGQAPDGWRIFVTPKPASTPDKVKLDVEMYLYTKGENPDSMWILDSCVASKAGAIACGTPDQQTIEDTQGGTETEDVIALLENIGTTVEDVQMAIETAPTATPQPVSVSQNPIILLAFALIAWFASGYIKR